MALAAGLAMKLHRIITNGCASNPLMDQLPKRIENETGLTTFAGVLEPSGIWPKYFPLFNYKKKVTLTTSSRC